jgi:predicted methyltransferase
MFGAIYFGEGYFGEIGSEAPTPHGHITITNYRQALITTAANRQALITIESE